MLWFYCFFVNFMELRTGNNGACCGGGHDLNNSGAYWQICYLLLVYLCLFFAFFYLEVITFNGTPSYFFRTVGAIADGTLVLMPLTFIRGRWRFSLALVPMFISLLVLCNVLYFRCFNDLIPSSSYFGSSLGNSLVIDGAFASLRTTDLTLLVTALVPIVFYILSKDNLSFRHRTKQLRYSLLLVLCATWAITLAGAYRRESIYLNSTSISKVLPEIYPDFSVDWKNYYSNTNFAGYSLRCIQQALVREEHLSDEKIEEMRNFMLQQAEQFSFREDELNQSKKNLIMIVVESLQSNVLRLNKGKAQISTLDSLIADSSTVYVEKCKVWADKGRSSDAQFVYNTGLLPLSREPLVTNYAAKDYPSIAKATKFNSVEIIGENKSLWSHGITSKSYGFDKLVDGIAEHVINQDSIIMNCALGEISKMQSPLFAFITTISMHDPYDKCMVQHNLNHTLLKANACTIEYLERLNHFDKSLNRFLAELKTQGIYKQSIIMIIGDHALRREANVEFPDENYVPLIILNSGRSDYRKTNVSQLDIFPTIIDMLQIRYEYMQVPYTGFGSSIFQLYPAADSHSARKYSEWIITRLD